MAFFNSFDKLNLIFLFHSGKNRERGASYPVPSWLARFSWSVISSIVNCLERDARSSERIKELRKEKKITILTGLAPFSFNFRMAMAAGSLFTLITRNIHA